MGRGYWRTSRRGRLDLKDEKDDNQLYKDMGAKIAADAALNAIRNKSKPKYEKPEITLGNSGKAKEGSWAANQAKKLAEEAKTERLKKFVPNKIDSSLTEVPDYLDDPKMWWNKDVTKLSDRQLNDISKNGRSNLVHNLNTKKEYPKQFNFSENRARRKKYVDIIKASESELINRGWEKEARKAQDIKTPSTRPHIFRQGYKTLRSVGPIGMALGLLAPSADAAVLPYSDVAEDKAIEDPSSPEFKARRDSLIRALKGK